MTNNNYIHGRAEGAIRTGTVDLAGFGRLYISKVDLVKNNWPLNAEAGFEVYYTSSLGVNGYNDFTFTWSRTSLVTG